MRYTPAQWLTFVVLVVVNAIVAVLLVVAAQAPSVIIVAYAIVIPVLFRPIIVASGELRLGAAAQAIGVWRAMRRGDIVMYFQPKVTLASGEILAAEALARWVHPRQGVLPPAAWLPATERFAWLGRPFFLYTLDASCRHAAAWRQAGRDIRPCVNVAPSLFAEDGTLTRDIRAALERWDLPPSAIEIEVTEHALDFSDRTETVATELAKLGISLALDDFGTGHSSMERLVRLPISDLKIDRSFVTDMLFDDRKRAVVRSACSLGHSLGISVVAEGIETVAVLDALKRLGCDVGQGYLFSRALPIAAFEDWLEDNNLDTLTPKTDETSERRAILRRQEDRLMPTVRR